MRIDIGDRRLSAFRRWLRCCAAALLTWASPTALADGLSTSAEYIVGFVRYVHWPNEDAIGAWRVCAVGDLPTEQDRLYANEQVRGKQFEIRRVAAADPVVECQVLDLTAVDEATAKAVLARTRTLPILSVSSAADYCSDGGVICLHLHAPAPKFEINLSAARESGLGVSSKLLMLRASHAAEPGG
jgi:hypothetical protein